MKNIIGLGLLLLVAGCSSQNQAENRKDLTMDTHQDSISYCIGMDIASSFNNQLVDVSPEVFFEGFITKYKGDSTRISEADMRTILTAFSSELRTKQKEVADVKLKENLDKGNEFLAENRKKDGVVETASGLQYKVLTSATGATPKADDKVKVDYTGRLLDGSVFDSSVERGKPATFRVTGVIKGWTEALQLMHVGEKWELYIPADLAYGERGSGRIEPNSLLIFEVELLGIEK